MTPALVLRDESWPEAEAEIRRVWPEISNGTLVIHDGVQAYTGPVPADLLEAVDYFSNPEALEEALTWVQEIWWPESIYEAPARKRW